MSSEKSAALATKILIAACIISFVAEFFIHRHPHFSWESFPGFYALFGFGAYCFIVLTAKSLRPWLHRPEDYYDKDDASTDAAEKD